MIVFVKTLATHEQHRLMRFDQHRPDYEGVVPGDLVRHVSDRDCLGLCLSRRWSIDSTNSQLQCDVLWTKAPRL